MTPAYINGVAIPPVETGLLPRLYRRKSWFLAGFGATACVVAVAFSAMPVTYRSTAALMVASNNEVLRGNSSGAEAQRLGDPADIESQMLMLRSPRLAGMLLDDPKVREALVADCETRRQGTWFTRLLSRVVKPRKSCGQLVKDRQVGLGWLAAGFAVAPTGRSRVIEASFSSPVAETTVVIANALADAYLADDLARKVDTHEQAIQWLHSEMERSAQALRKAEMDVEDYRRSHGIVRGQLASITSERLSELSQQLVAGQAAYAAASARRAEYDKGAAQMSEVIASRSVADLKQQVATLSARYSALTQQYGDRYPAVQTASIQLRDAQRRLDEESRRVGASLARDEQAAAARLTELNRQFNTMMKEVGDAGGAEAGIATMVRDLEARRAIFVDQLKRVNELETERRLLAGDARLVNYAELPDRPWFPKKMPFALIGCVLAGAAGTGAALLRDRSDKTMRAVAKLPRIGGVPVLGYIPWVRERSSESSAVIRTLDRPSALQEAVRSLFGHFLLLGGKMPRVLMVGSSVMDEGKTFLVLAIALFASTTGRRVLVIDGDLRRPSIQKQLRLPPGPGLSDYLRGEAEVKDVVSQHFKGFDVIAAGCPAIDSMELLSNGELTKLLRWARQNYDFVLIDSPPSLLLVDARLMARHTDGVLYCADFGRSRVERIAEGMEGIQEAGGRVVGVVAGMVRDREFQLYEPSRMRKTDYLPVTP